MLNVACCVQVAIVLLALAAVASADSYGKYGKSSYGHSSPSYGHGSSYVRKFYFVLINQILKK